MDPGGRGHPRCRRLLAGFLGTLGSAALVGLAVVLVGIVVLVAAQWPPRRMPHGQQLLRRASAFRGYLQTAVARRRQLAEHPATFMRYLGYAVAFGCAGVWADAFSDVDGKTMLANCLGHIAARRQHSVLMFRTERLLKRLKAARLEGTYDQELRRLIRVDLLILDDFALHPLDVDATQDVYEVVVERHRRASTVVVSNREPQEWLPTMADPLLAQSAVDRLLNSAYELVLEGESYRRRQKPGRAAR